MVQDESLAGVDLYPRAVGAETNEGLEGLGLDRSVILMDEYDAAEIENI